MTNSGPIKKKTSAIDWISVCIFIGLMIIGWTNIYAAVYDDSGSAFSWGTKYASQLMWMGVSLTAAVVIMFLDDIYYHILAYPFYFVMLLLLLVTLLVGSEINGAKSWLRFGGISLQPVEFAKMATALALARYMSSCHFVLTNRRNLLTVCALLGVPIIVIILQNDMGSALVYFAFLMVLYREGLNGWVFIILGMAIYLFVFSFILQPLWLLISVIVIYLLMEGVMYRNWKSKIIQAASIALGTYLLYLGLNFVLHINASPYICLLIVSVLSLVPVAINAYKNKLRNVIVTISIFLCSLVFINVVDYVFDNMLQLHQQKRILNLLGVESDTQKWGYNVNQSKIAIGSGGFFGKGYMQGTQTKYDFVPEQSTDFIFCTVGEEWGFVGSTIVLALFCLLIIRLIMMGERQKEAFGRVYCYSVAAIIFMHVVINVGMTIGIMPVIGIPLPLFSYGGSSLLAFTMLFFVAVKLDSSKREPGTAINR